jgi:hypothetical protein
VASATQSPRNTSAQHVHFHSTRPTHYSILHPLTVKVAPYSASRHTKPRMWKPLPRLLYRANLYFLKYLYRHLYRAISRIGSTSLCSLQTLNFKTSSKHILPCFRHYSACTLPPSSQTPRPRRGGGAGLGGVVSEDEGAEAKEEVADLVGSMKTKGDGHKSREMRMA